MQKIEISFKCFTKLFYIFYMLCISLLYLKNYKELTKNQIKKNFYCRKLSKTKIQASIYCELLCVYQAFVESPSRKEVKEPHL